MDGTSLSLIKCFENVEDPRVDRTMLHKLIDIIVMAICALVAGADSFDAIEIRSTELNAEEGKSGNLVKELIYTIH